MFTLDIFCVQINCLNTMLLKIILNKIQYQNIDSYIQPVYFQNISKFQKDLATLESIQKLNFDNSTMSDKQQQASNEISIEDLELSLELYEIQSDQKLKKLQDLFNEKKTLDLRQVFYEERSSLEVKFQNIVGDLTQFLINQEVPSTQKLRKTFYRILESPLLLLFKVSRFEIFNLRLNAFDIQLEPIDAITELAKLLYKNIDEYVTGQNNQKTEFIGSTYQSYDQFLQHSKINLIQDEIFILYSYLRKGSGILKKKVEDKIKVVEVFSTIEQKIITALLKNQDVKTLKQLSILNYEIYLLENGFDVLCFYLKVPLRNIYRQVFKQLQILANKAKLTCNYDMFINIFVKFNQEILAKISQQKIDQSYVDYIENVALTLLQLWGCRICQFRQFFKFFKSIFQAYPNQKKLLEICLKHTPNLSKQDISLMRANYRQNVENKNVQLLSLLKKVSLDDINNQLNTIYHQILYNLNFQTQSKETIISLLTLVNGNSSLEGLIFTVEKALKQWNHTIDFNNNLKFIESQFSIPKNLTAAQIAESLRLFTNLCILQGKGFEKQFQQLVTKGTLTKAMTGICKFLLSSEEQVIKFIQQNKICETFILWTFKFLQNTLLKNSTEWEELLYLFANSIKYFSIKQNQQQIKDQICQHIKSNLETYRLGKCMRILKKTFEFDRESTILSFIVNLMMKQTAEKSKQNRNYRFFGKPLSKVSNQVLSIDESDFLKKYACIKNDAIEVKQTSCFKLTQLQVITNPIQFQKAMDNYYFTLDSNSKRFIQYVVQQFTNQQQSSQTPFYSELISILIFKYPVSIPILCNIRIKPNQNSKQTVQYRFAEFLVNQLLAKQGNQVKSIIGSIINTETIKYRNGRDYVIEEIVPMIAKRTLTLINASSLKAGSANLLTIQIYEILATTLDRFRLTDLKIDTIQKSLLKINYEILNSQCQRTINRLSSCFDQIMKVFFRKKQIDIKKRGLEKAYEQIVWNQIRTYNRSSGESQPSKPVQSKAPVINEQIMVSPYTLSQEYNNEQYKIRKSENQNNISKEEQSKKIKLSEILPNITRVESQNDTFKSSEQTASNQTKQIDLSKMKYNIELDLGSQELSYLQNKQNWLIKQKYSSRASLKKVESIEKQTTFVQYYLREMSYPQISDGIAIKSILAYLKKQIQVSLIWSNPKNLEKMFVPLIVLFDFITTSNKNVNSSSKLKTDSQTWQQLISYITQNRIESIKSILKLLSDIGYTNLWGENYKSFTSLSYILKTLEIKVIEEESFLSIVLKKVLEYEQINEIKGEIDIFFDKIFTTRPAEQTSLMYKVGIDKNLLNLIMKSLQIKNLSNISFLFHSNFNNLRLYTDQLHQGLKALNMASKTRSYNEYIQLSKQIQDEQFLGPMKLFQQNFGFFIKIQKQGYNFKKSEQKKLCLERLTNVLRKYEEGGQKQTVCKEADKLIQQYQEEIQKLEISIANRVKSFYLVTKLRDLSYQNSISMHLISEILREKSVQPQQILQEIKKVDIFALIMTLHKELVRFDNAWDDLDYYQKYNCIDQNLIQKQTSFCTTRRFSHSMNKVYQKCDLELDQVIQRCLDQLKLFLSTPEGTIYLQQNESIFYPAFFVKSFVQGQENIKSSLIKQIRSNLQKSPQKLNSLTFNLKKSEFITEFITQTREANKKLFYTKNAININLQGQIYTLDKFVQIVAKHLINNETLVWSKTKESQFLTFNKYKTSQATLQQIQALGYIVAYCLYHRIPLVKDQTSILPLNNCIIAALSFNIIDIEDLLNVDFKTWEDVKRILSIQDSKTLNLNFSYIFEDLKTLKDQRIELVDKGASKKVNNLNREQFCDSIACHVIFNNLKPQLSRFIHAILSVIPKQLLSCQKLSQIYPLFYNKQYLQKVMKIYIRKVGIITPELVLRDNKRIQNLRDYQNIQWAVQLILQSQKLRQKYWKDQSNIFILTTIGPKPSLSFNRQTLIIQHFQSKQAMSQAFSQLN